uniref:Single-stranded DNA-binding protein n=1 Tax=Meloidogyne hapla TaxID=6305 RepID=A0A1I8C080_MELHA
MFDRVTRLSKDFGGLEFFLEDEALVEEFIYSNPFDYRNLNIQTDKEKYEIFLTPEFWEAFFKFVKIWKEGKYEKSLEIKWKEEEKKLKSKYHQNEPGTSSLNQDFASTSSIRG